MVVKSRSAFLCPWIISNYHNLLDFEGFYRFNPKQQMAFLFIEKTQEPIISYTYNGFEEKSNYKSSNTIFITYKSKQYVLHTGDPWNPYCEFSTSTYRSSLHYPARKASLPGRDRQTVLVRQCKELLDGAFTKFPHPYSEFEEAFYSLQLSFSTAHRTTAHITTCILTCLPLCGVYIRPHGHRTWPHAFPSNRRQVLSRAVFVQWEHLTALYKSLSYW